MVESSVVGVEVAVPETLQRWVKERAARGGYESASAYLAELIRRDQQDESGREEIVAALAAGEASGVSARGVPDILAALKDELDAERR